MSILFRFFRYHIASLVLLLGFTGYQLRHNLLADRSEYEETETDSPDVPVDQFNRLTADPSTGTIPSLALAEARQFVQDYITSNGANHPQAPNMGGFGGIGSNTMVGLNWYEIGPTQVGGRTRALLVDKGDASGNTVWAGSAGGGLWKTTNGGQSWVRWNDFFDNLAISCLVQHPTNPLIMYFGTGEGWFNYDAIKGEGIWRTIDGGHNWLRLNNSVNTGSSSPALPGNHRILLEYVQQLAINSNGDLFAATRNYGLLKLESGGANTTKQWERLNLPALASSGPNLATGASIPLNNATAVEIASNGDMFVGMHSYDAVTQSPTPNLYYNGDRFGSAVYKCTQSTGIWSRLTTMPDNGTTPGNPGYKSNHERYTITIGPAVVANSPYTVYIVTSKHDPVNYTTPFAYEPSHLVQGMYRSTNGGTTWTSCVVPVDPTHPNNSFAREQAWYNLMLKVSPANGNFLYCGGIDLYQSINGGQTWQRVTKSAAGAGYPPVAHSDWHVMAFSNTFPTNPKAYFAGDGGVYSSGNANTVATSASGPALTPRNDGYNTVQFYSVATDQSNTVLGGTQDNHTRVWSGLTIQPTTYFETGDGGHCFIDTDNPNFRLIAGLFNSWMVSFNGSTFATLSPSNGFGPGINPADYDDANNLLYSVGAKGTYYRYSNFQQGSPPTSLCEMFSLPAPYNTDYITHIRVSPNYPSTLYVTVRNSLNDRPVILKVLNANTIPAGTVAVQNLSGASFPVGGNISCIEIETGVEAHAVATLYNYGAVGAHFSNVWESTDFTAPSSGWTSCDGQTGGLKNIPVRWALFNPANTDELLIATEVGVWSTADLNGANTAWFPANNGLANVRTDMLFLRPSDHMVFAATHGRGVYWTDIFCNSQIGFSASRNNACINEIITFTAVSNGILNPTYSWDLNGDGVIDKTGISTTVCSGYGSNVKLVVNGSNLLSPIAVFKPSFIKLQNCYAAPCGGGGGASSASSGGGDLDSTASRPLSPDQYPGRGSVSLHPNPAKDRCYLDLNLREEMSVSAEVISTSGRKMLTALDRELVPSGNRSYSFPVSSLPSGHYILRVQVGQEIVSRPFMIAR